MTQSAPSPTPVPAHLAVNAPLAALPTALVPAAELAAGDVIALRAGDRGGYLPLTETDEPATVVAYAVPLAEAVVANRARGPRAALRAAEGPRRRIEVAPTLRLAVLRAA